MRWNQLGTYYPFFRGHGHLETKRREPWLFGEDNTRRNRASLRERYALLPYLYTLFWESHTQGTPIMRPLWYEFPEVSEVALCPRRLVALLFSAVWQPATLCGHASHSYSGVNDADPLRQGRMIHQPGFICAGKRTWLAAVLLAPSSTLAAP